MKTVLGIDPGKDGFFATLSTEGEIATYPMPVMATGKGSKRAYDVPAVWKLFEELTANVDLIVLEKQQAMRGQGVTSTFTTGQGFGMLELACVACKKSYVIVHPRTWKKVQCRDIAGTDPKAKSIIAAQRMFPNVDLKKTPRCTTPHDGMADALLLASYGLNHVLGKE